MPNFRRHLETSEEKERLRDETEEGGRMNEEVVERLAASFEKIATALEGIHEEVRRAGTRYWPEPREQKEAILSHVPTEEDRIRERQGAGDDRPIDEWLSDLGDPEGEAGIVGERSRQWIIDHPPEKAKVPDARAEVASVGKSDATSTEEAESKA
jgi:hypothetical protein